MFRDSGSALGPSSARLNIATIENSLREVQREFPRLKTHLRTDRDSMDDEIVENLLSGYSLVDEFISEQIKLFSLGNLKYFLELNYTVLCGLDQRKRENYSKHLEATENRFYAHKQGGIEDIMEWYAIHRNQTVWGRAAGVYLRILSDPQLFIEGNHRSGALVMSYILVSEGYPPFILTVENAKTYFDLSSRMTRLRKKTIEMALISPAINRKFARFLRKESNLKYLV